MYGTGAGGGASSRGAPLAASAGGRSAARRARQVACLLAWDLAAGERACCSCQYLRLCGSRLA